MKQAVVGAVLAIAMAGLGTAQEKQPLQVTNPQLGLTFTRPPDEKWKVQETGRWYNTCIGVAHVIDNFQIDATAAFLEPNTRWPDGGAKTVGEDALKDYREKTKSTEKDKPPQFKEFKVIAAEEKAKYPGAGSPTAYHIHALITEQDDSVREFHEWIFFKSNNLYRVVAYGAKGEFEKKQKEAGAILGSLNIKKPEKKK